MNSRLDILLTISSGTCFVLAVVAELLHFNILSCVLAVALLAFVFWLVLPKLIKRFKKKQGAFINFLNFVALILFAFDIVFLMAVIIYFLVWGRKFWDNYSIVLYAGVLLYLLVESYLSFIYREKYKLRDYLDE